MNICQHLNYQRSLSPYRAVFYYKTSNGERVPLMTNGKKFSGQRSDHSAAFGTGGRLKKVTPQDLAYPNPQTMDECYVPFGVNEIFCQFALRVNANSLAPAICNDQKVWRWLVKLAAQYKQKGGYHELARRYCKNILMGTWLWRNQYSAPTQIEVVTENGSRYVIDETRLLDWHGHWDKDTQVKLEEFAAELAEALSEPRCFWRADIIACLQTDLMQDIYPSQRFTENKKGESARQFETALTAAGDEMVCFNDRKVGAAIQMIDDWWSDPADKRLRVHEYGADRQFCIAQRFPENHKDFYSLIKKVAVFIRQLRHCNDNDGTAIPPDIHYIMSVLCKGGLFQRGSE